MTRPASVIAAPLAAGAVALGACGGGSSPSHTTGGGDRAGGASATSASPARSAAAETQVAAWPQRKLVRRLRGHSIEVEGRRVPVDPTTITCQGVGRSVRRAGVLMWTRFHCIQTTFPAHAVAGPDAVFDVHPTGPRSFLITGARFVRY
jgi:hypothetical protein